MFLFGLIISTALVLSTAAPQEDPSLKDKEFYQKVFEEVDPDTVLDNPRLLNSYLKCFYDEGPCSGHAKVVKESITPTLSTVCGYCSEKQKSIFKYTLNKFIPVHPADWERILTIYDPDKKYWPDVKTFIES
uniref:Chemosensory protein n=1 Tax=Corythucha ciliata TaxID=369451 RepID=A0A2S0M1E3_CORCT|nr:chemosensory protein [Corythucha ciliata]